MKRAWLLLPAMAAFLLAAHFYRSGSLILAVAAAATVVLLTVPRPWAARVVQGVLIIGAIEWLRALAAIAAYRIAIEQPYLRLTVILLTVAVFTAASALVFRQPALRGLYRLPS